MDAMEASTPTILQNTDSVGNHVCTWVRTNSNGYTIRTKLYNKVVCNSEAGEVLQPISGHLAEYVDCLNKHLRKTFLHPDVQKRGCTRIEVSLYVCTREDLATNVAEKLIQNALETVSPNGDGLFRVQSPKRQ